MPPTGEVRLQQGRVSGGGVAGAGRFGLQCSSGVSTMLQSGRPVITGEDIGDVRGIKATYSSAQGLPHGQDDIVPHGGADSSSAGEGVEVDEAVVDTSVEDDWQHVFCFECAAGFKPQVGSSACVQHDLADALPDLLQQPFAPPDAASAVFFEQQQLPAWRDSAVQPHPFEHC